MIAHTYFTVLLAVCLLVQVADSASSHSIRGQDYRHHTARPQSQQRQSATTTTTTEMDNPPQTVVSCGPVQGVWESPGLAAFRG